LDNKTIYLPAGDGKTTYVVRTDFADAGANVLLDETGKYHNKSIELGGVEGFSWTAIAKIISEITGVEIAYVSPSNEEFTDALTKAGVPAEYIGLFASFSNAAKEGEFANVTGNLKDILGREPETVKQYLQKVYGK
jgi:NAD(P)H dehydrogenase (quinone)